MSSDWSDDILIASVLEYSQEKPDAKVTLITQDSGPRFQCLHLGLDTIQLGDEWKLPAQPDDDEAEAKRLKLELERFKNALPRLQVVLLTDGEYSEVREFTISAPEPPDFGDANRLLTAVEVKYPVRTAIDLKPMSHGAFLEADLWNHIKPEEYERYNRDRQRYLNEYRQYLGYLHEYKNARKRTIEFEIAVLNVGSSPAKDVDIHLHFPDGFTLSNDGGPYIPNEPAPPKPPQSRVDQIKEVSRFVPLSSGHFLRPMDFSTSSFTIKRTHSYDITDHAIQIKHGDEMRLPKLFLTFDSFDAARPFHCDYKVRAGNLVDPVGGQLHFRTVKS